MECFKNIQENIEGQLKKGLITKKEEKSPVKNYQTATMLFDSSPGEPGCDALEKHSSGITECLDGGPRVGFTNRKKERLALKPLSSALCYTNRLRPAYTNIYF